MHGGWIRTPKNEVTYKKEMFWSPSGKLSYTHFNNCAVTTRNTSKPTPQQQTWMYGTFSETGLYNPQSISPTATVNEFMHL